MTSVGRCPVDIEDLHIDKKSSVGLRTSRICWIYICAFCTE